MAIEYFGENEIDGEAPVTCSFVLCSASSATEPVTNFAVCAICDEAICCDHTYTHINCVDGWSE
jgi:hypothetical protein